MAKADTYKIDEDTTLNISAGEGVLANDVDPDPDEPITAAIVSGPSHGTVILAADGSFVYEPAPDYYGADTFTYKANDGVKDSNVASVTVTVSPVNDVPSFTKGQDQSVREDAGPQTVEGWAADISTGPSNESRQKANFVVTTDNRVLFSRQPAVSPDDTLTYTPAANKNGTATVDVRVRDDGGTGGGGVNASEPQQFTISVSPANDRPVISRIPDRTIVENTSTARLPFTVSDPETGAGELKVTASLSNAALVPARGIVLGGSGRDHSIKVTPARNKTGTARITVTATDADGAVATAAFSIIVKPKGEPPKPGPRGCTITGTNSSEILRGTPKNDVICGLGGNDVIFGLGDNDVLKGGPGHDTLIGGPGKDELIGGPGRNRLRQQGSALNRGTQETLFRPFGQDFNHHLLLIYPRPQGHSRPGDRQAHQIGHRHRVTAP